MSQAVSGSTCMGALWSVYWKLSSVADPHSHLESSRRLAKLLGYELSDIPELMRGLRDLDNMNPDMRPKICRNGLMVLVSGIEDFIDDFLDDQQTDGSEVDDMYMTVGDKLRYLIHSCDELKRIFVKKGRLGTSAEYRPDVLPPSSLDATAGLVGIVSSREKLVNWLMEKEEQPKGVTIVGAPGSGKTTLATDVFRQIEGHFQYGVTVSVSPQPEMNKLFEHVLSQMDPNLCRPSEKLERDWQETYMEKQERLMSSIIQFLQNKRCLFLIDDVWDGTSWDIIQSVLLKGCSGNRIIVTTQNVMIEDSCSKHCSWLWHTVMPLSEQQSWMLFSRNVFASQDGKCPDHLRKACKEIMKKCEGLPSAITAISYLMKEHWKVQSSTIPRTEMIPELRTLSKRLFSSSYMHLTQPLRTLLLYMSMFIYECKIEKGPLICKWIAEGFYSPQTYTRMERLAELDYFHLIAWNVIIAPMPTGRPTKPAFGLCRVHSLVHQAIESTSAEECFLFTSNTLKSIDSDKARRISLQYYDPDLPSLLERLDLKFTYSLTLFDEVNRVPLEKFTMLRVLDMQGWKNVEEDDLSVICNMHLLKYLSLRNTRVSLIPSLIKQLHFLQTLDIRQTHISELPPEVCELRHLRNAYFGETYISELPPQIEKLRELERLEIAQTKISKLPSEFSGLLYLKELNLSQTKITNLPPQFKALNQLKSLDLSHTNISKLPSEVCKLKHLETLDLRGTKVVHLSKQVIQLRQLEHLFVGSDDYSVNARVTLPDGIRHLRFLKTLVTVDLSRCSTSVVHELSEIRELKELAMVWSSDEQSLDRKYVECLLSSLRSLHCLTCLTILGHYGCSMEFLHSLKNLPSLLQSLKITGTLSKVPDWITQLKDLCYIQVKVCKFGDDELIVLGQLQNLQYLKLGLEFLPEKEMVIRTEGFPSLERFSVDCRVLWLLFDKGAMPLLATLELKFCSGQVNHNAIPIVGIQHLQRLNHVILRYSTLYDNVPGVKATVDTMKNAIRNHLYPIKLVINGIEDDLEANVLRQHACTTQIKCDGDSKIESEIKEQREDARQQEEAGWCYGDPAIVIMAQFGRSIWQLQLKSFTK